jgi:uncharacterized membrane protein
MKQFTDEKIDTWIGIVLRFGVIAAAVLVTCGGFLYLAGRGSGAASFTMWAGLGVLIATPVVRVIACAIGFGLERDWTYVVVSLIVLLMLCVSWIG